MNVGRLTALLATAGCLAGWARLAYTALGPTYLRCADPPRGGLACATHSMVELRGIPPSFFVLAAAFGSVALGALLVWRGYRTGRWLMVVAMLPIVGMTVLGGLVGLLMPLTAVLVLATITAFASPDE